MGQREGVKSSDRVAIVGGHGRGYISARTFMDSYQQEFKDVFGFGLDGEPCRPHQESIVSDYFGLSEPVTIALSSFVFPLGTGIMRLAITLSASLQASWLTGGESD